MPRVEDHHENENARWRRNFPIMLVHGMLLSASYMGVARFRTCGVHSCMWWFSKQVVECFETPLL